MNAVEDALIARLDARAATGALTPRQRQVLVGRFRHGDTLRVCGEVLGISGGRVGQIERRALQALRSRLTRQSRLPLPWVPPGFDVAAFLKHQAKLIVLRAEERRQEFARDREELGRLLKWEIKYGNQPPPSVAPWKPQPPSVAPWKYQPTPSVAPAKPTLNAESLQSIVGQALRWFTELRQLETPGYPVLGYWCTDVTFAWYGSSVYVAMQELAGQIRADARFSKAHLPITYGYSGAHASNDFVSVRAMLIDQGRAVRFDVTWDGPVDGNQQHSGSGDP